MKSWYKHPLTKIILVITAIVTPAIAAVSLVLLAGFLDSDSLEQLFQAGESQYEETDSFESLMLSAMTDMLVKSDLASNLETDGKYDPEKLVDIMEYAETGKITGKNISGAAYRIGDLVEWAEKENLDNEYEIYGESMADIIVCQKEDDTYHYYWLSEFKDLLANGGLRLEVGSDEREQLLEELEEGYIWREDRNLLVRDEAEGTVYTDVWTYDGTEIQERFAPDGAEDLLEVVNDTPELNGKLSEVYENLIHALGTIGTQVNRYEDSDLFTEGNTNFIYLFVNENQEKVYTNNSTFRKYEDVEKNMTAIAKQGNFRYVIVKPTLSDFESNLDVVSTYWQSHVNSYHFLGENYSVMAAVDTSYPIQDIFYQEAENYNAYMPYMDPAAKALVVSLLLFLTAMIWLTVAAGRKADGENGLFLNPFDHWKTELSAALVFIPWLLITMLGLNIWNGVGYQNYVYPNDEGYVYYAFNMSAEDVCVIAAYAVVTAILVLVGYLSLVRRIKARSLWKDSLLRILFIWTGKAAVKCHDCVRTFWRHRRVLWKTILAYCVFLAFQWLPVMTSYGMPGFPVFLMAAVDIAAAVFLIRNALEKEQIKNGIREIASGNLNYQFPVKRFQGGDYQDMSENLSNIGNGLQRAVEKSMRDERLKTDLITNVSHDIKTPLTSIINYVDLLKRENFEDPKIQGYLDILEMKSQRLKTLTEDVVEASKVSSGNITLEYMDVDLVEMLNQTIGEFSEKMEAKQLKVIASLPEEPVVIHVDGRRMWRVLENIFNNAAKYAMSGTRVYADLKKEGKKIRFSLKNISEQPLNFSSDELTERFIRGDVSRSTEGSGLGLSIAKSLTEMQGGKFELYLDGDLFKVTIEFE